LDGGADIVQFRTKKTSVEEAVDIGKKIKDLLKGKNVLFIVNDNIKLALELDADGIHLGQDDLPIDTARTLIGKEKIIGLSTHSIAQMHEAVKKDVDYISIGPVFSTPTKPDYKAVGLDIIKIASKEIKLPFVAIGGIDESNIKDVILAGAKRIAVVRAILSSQDPFTATKNLYDSIRTCKTE